MLMNFFYIFYYRSEIIGLMYWIYVCLNFIIRFPSLRDQILGREDYAQTQHSE
jgi:hypothetical protein